MRLIWSRLSSLSQRRRQYVPESILILLTTMQNLSAIDSVNKAAREIAKSNVKAWAADFDHESPLPRSKTSSSAPRASTSQVRVPDVKAGVGEGKSTGAYKGFGIPTPRSYELAKKALEDKASKVESRLAWQKRNNGSGEADVGGSTVGHDASSKVIARASPYPTVNSGGGGAWKRPPPDRRTSTPSRAGPSRDPIGSSVTPIPLSKQLRSTPRLSQTKAASSQFKPPSFTTPPAALAGRGAPRSGQGLSVIGATRRGDGRTTGDVKDSARAKLEQEWIRSDSDQRDREMD